MYMLKIKKKVYKCVENVGKDPKKGPKHISFFYYFFENISYLKYFFISTF